MKCGLLALNEDGILVGETSKFDYSGDIPDQEESDRLSRALGPSNKVLVLPNFGIMACGFSIEDAFVLARQIMSACETQVRDWPFTIMNHWERILSGVCMTCFPLYSLNVMKYSSTPGCGYASMVAVAKESL